VKTTDVLVDCAELKTFVSVVEKRELETIKKLKTNRLKTTTAKRTFWPVDTEKMRAPLRVFTLLHGQAF
jgi:hypothetical protein